MLPSHTGAWTRRRWKVFLSTITNIISSTSLESKSIQGVGLIKLQFHPGTDMAGAMAETVNYVNRSRAFMPTGTVSPFVMRFDAGSVPVGDLVLSDESGKLGLKELQDAALFRV